MKKTRSNSKRNINSKYKFKKSSNTAIYNKSVLPNGLKVISEEIPGVESIAIGISINAGSRDDTPSKEGLAHFMEHIAYRHTKSKNSRQIAEGFESVGAYTNAFTTQEHTCFYVRTLKKHFKKTLGLLADITVNPIFRQKDIEKEKLIILEEIKSTLDDPEELLFDHADRIAFGEHPLGNPITGNLESVATIKYEDLIEFHSRFYVPANMIITAAGNITHDKLAELAEKLFGDLPAGKSNNLREPPENNHKNNVIQKLNINQSHQLLGKRAGSFHSNERYELLLLNTMLGDGMSSRLYQKLREKKAMAYNIYSTINFYSDCGTFYIYLAADEKNLETSEKIIFEEFNKLNNKISETHLNKVKEQLKSQIIMELENLSNRMISLSKDELLLGENEPLNKVIREIDAVTTTSISQTASKFLNEPGWFKCSIIPDKN